MKSGPAGKRGRPEACRKSSSAYHGVTAGSLDTLDAFPSGVSALALRVAGGWLVKRHAGCAASKLCTPARLTFLKICSDESFNIPLKPDFA